MTRTRSDSASRSVAPTARASWRDAGPQDRRPRLLHRCSCPTTSSTPRWRRWSASRRRGRGHRALRVGMLVLGNDYKHPADRRQGGRDARPALGRPHSSSGIGAGWMKTDYEALGLPYDSAGTCASSGSPRRSPSSRAPGATSPFDFERPALHDPRLQRASRSPSQQPHPPILVGGGGPRLLRLAGREADIVGINPNLRAGAITSDALKTSLADQTAQKIGWVREGAGTRFDDLELQIRYFFAAITDDASGLAEAMAPGFGVSADEALVVRGRARRHRRRGLRHARRAPRAMGRLLRRRRRRQLRGVRARRRAARRHLRRSSAPPVGQVRHAAAPRAGAILDGSRGRGSAGRASPCQGEGRGFESRRPLHRKLHAGLIGWPTAIGMAHVNPFRAVQAGESTLTPSRH